MKVVAKGPVSRSCSPGDIVIITGVYMPSPFLGFAAMNKGLHHDTHIEAFKIIKDKQNFRDYMLSDEMMQKVKEIRDQCENEAELF